MGKLSHFDEQGASRMVDTTAKQETAREARASGSGIGGVTPLRWTRPHGSILAP